MLHEDEIVDGHKENNKADDYKTGYVAAVFFTVLVAFSFMGIKVSQPYADSVMILCYRYDFAAIAIAVLMLFKVVRIDLRGRSKRNLLLTALFYVGFMALQVVGMLFATTIEGSVYFAIIPIIVKIIASVFLREKSTWKENCCVCLTVFALIFMIIMGAGSIDMNPIGVILLLLSSVSMAMSNVFMRYTRADYKPIEITFTIIVMGFVSFNVAAVIKSLAMSQGITDYFRPLMNPEILIATAYLGIGCILLSAHLMSYMLSKMEAVTATIFGNVSTTISIIAGALILGEPLEWYHVICTILIISGVVGLCVLSLKRNKAEQ